MRRCTKCAEEYPETSFNKDSSKPDGLYPSCKSCTRKTCKRTYRKHHEKHVALKRRWKTENQAARSEIGKKWRAANPDKVREGTRLYRRRRATATPPWVDTRLVKMVYEECPPGYHVDHIYPLAHVDFCGLHIPDNLQILPAMANFRKGNRAPDVGGRHL